jgi:hypothetical protein
MFSLLNTIFPADQLTIVVSDETGKVPLPNSTVTVTNRETGKKFVGIADKSGFYKIPLSSFGSVGSVVVNVTHAGRNDEVLTSSGKNVITIQMQPAVKEVGEVVITAPKRKPAAAPAAPPVPKKKFPWIAVAGGAVVLGVAIYFLAKGVGK